MHPHFGILFILGVGAFAGTLGAWLFQRMRIPQVVGYIVIGLIIGESGLHLVRTEHIDALQPFNFFALGLIGLLVGGELRFAELRKYRRQFTAILLGEGLGAFFLVGLPTGIIVYAVTHNLSAAFAAGIVFGAIASATDPASTIDVLWEYRARGVLSTALVAIVALDDALAMTLYGLGTSTADIITSSSVSLMAGAGRIAVELLGAVALGVVFGFILNTIIRRVHAQEKVLAISIGTLLLVIGISVWLDMDIILATMTLGIMVANLAPHRSQSLFALVRSVSIPIYVLFFVLVGARLGLGRMPGWLWIVVGVYVIGRTAGKIAGTYIGGRLTRSAPVIQRYGGLGLFAQGGVAVGLSIMASQHLKGSVTGELSLGEMVILTVTATTLIMQIIGPFMVRLAIRKADELGRNVTEEDIVRDWLVRDVMDAGAVSIPHNTPLRRVFHLFAESDQLAYPVVAGDNRLVGCLTFEDMKGAAQDQDCWDWLLAADVVPPVRETVLTTAPLETAIQLMQDIHAEQLPVVENNETMAAAGILDLRAVRHRIREELLHRAPPE